MMFRRAGTLYMVGDDGRVYRRVEFTDDAGEWGYWTGDILA